MKVTIPVPAMTGGVSQQPAELRLRTQCAESINALASVVEGLKKRPPTKHEARMVGAPLTTAAHHTIDRDTTETYHAVFGDQAIKVFDLENLSVSGTSGLPVRDNTGALVNTAALSYLASENPQADIKALTVSDYTLVVNRSIKPAFKGTTTTTRQAEGLVLVRQGNYRTKYIISVELGSPHNRTVTVTYETYSASGQAPGGGTNKNISDAEASVQTDLIAKGLADGLTEATIGSSGSPHGYTTNLGSKVSRVGTQLPSTWSVQAKNSVLHISAANGETFKLNVDDSVGSTTLTPVKDTVQLFADLPVTAPDGFKVRIVGDPEAFDVGYWVEFKTSSGDEAMAEGTWQETVAPGIEYELDPETMPHVLIRYQLNGAVNFRWTPLDAHTFVTDGDDVVVPGWGTRSVGDDKTNPDPAFVGQAISNIFFHKSRLGILSGESVSLSESGELFSFFKTTTLQLLDTARISLIAPSNQVVDLLHGVPLSDSLVLLSERNQFILRSNGPLTPTTVSIDEAGFYDASDVEPLVMKQSILVPATRGEYATVTEMQDVSSDRPRLMGAELTLGIPTYIPGKVTARAVSKTESIAAFATDADESSIWVYSWFDNGGERPQQAWQRFDLMGSPRVRHMHFVDSKLWVFSERDTGLPGASATELQAETIDFEPFKVDAGQEWLCHLDRKITVADILGASYELATKETTVKLPYTFGDHTDPAEWAVYSSDGRRLEVVRLQNDNEIVFKGGAQDGFIGMPYTMRYEFSEVVLRDRNNTPVPGELRTKLGRIIYAGTTSFAVEVTSRLGQVSRSVFTGFAPGRTKIGRVPKHDGRWQFVVPGNSKSSTVALVNDTAFACRFLAAEFDCNMMYLGGTRR